MTLLIANLTLSLLIPLITGYALLVFLCQENALTLSLKVALAYGLGLGLLAFWMLFLGMTHQTFNVLSIGMPLTTLSCIFLLFSLKRKKQAFSKKVYMPTHKDPQPHGTQRILKTIFIVCSIVYIVHNTAYVFWRSLAIPISTWDAIATVAFKAKIFYFEQSLPSLDLLPHKTYPLLVPFVQSWIAFNLGYWDNTLIKILFPCAFLSYLIIHYKFLSHFVSKTWALLGCVILLSSNFFIYHATISYRDFFLMYFNCITIMLLLFWNQNKKNAFLILAALFAGFTTFVKLEGTAFLGIYAVLFCTINFPSKIFTLKEKWINSLKFFLPSIGICLTFHIYKIGQNVLREGSGIVDKTSFDFTWTKISLIPQIFDSFFQNLMFSGNWNIVWFVTFLSLVQFRWKRKNTEGRLIFLGLLLFFGLYFFVALLTVNFIWIAGEKSMTALSRLFLHFYPLAPLLIIFLNYPCWSSKNKA